MLHLRILSAIIGIPLILGLVYLGDIFYSVFVLLLAILGIHEYMLMLKHRGYHLPLFIGYVGVSVIIAVIHLGPLLGVNLFYPAIIAIFMTLALALLIYFEKADFAESALIFWGIIYLGGLCGYLILLRGLPEGLILTFLLFLGAWCNDTIAYFTGIKWGKRRLAPTISPKKSVEGALCGIVGTALLFFLLATLLPEWIGLTRGGSAIFGLVIAIFGQLGDLVESAMKRKFGVKDAGGLIPGHGGVLDRFDSLLFAAPVLYYYAQLIGQG